MSRKKRAAPFSYRPTVAERDAVIAAWKESGKSFSAFVTEAILRRPARRARRIPPLDQKLAALLLSQAARINDRLGTPGEGSPLALTDALHACRDELSEIRTCLMQLMGREP
mgnify:FL=1